MSMPHDSIESPASSSKTPAIRARILIVDDEKALCKMLCKQLDRCGHDITVRHDIRSGLEALSESFDVALLDVDLPDGRGFDLVAALRESSVRPTSVIMMTGNPNQDTLNQSLNQGILEFLFKPFGGDELRSSVARAIDANERWKKRVAILHGVDPETVRSGSGAVESTELPAGEISRLTQGLVQRHDLTEREQETLTLILQGLQNSEIAQMLDISANTVKYHVRNLLMKLGMESRTDLFRSLLNQVD